MPPESLHVHKPKPSGTNRDQARFWATKLRPERLAALLASSSLLSVMTNSPTGIEQSRLYSRSPQFTAHLKEWELHRLTGIFLPWESPPSTELEFNRLHCKAFCISKTQTWNPWLCHASLSSQKALNKHLWMNAWIPSEKQTPPATFIEEKFSPGGQALGFQVCYKEYHRSLTKLKNVQAPRAAVVHSATRQAFCPPATGCKLGIRAHGWRIQAQEYFKIPEAKRRVLQPAFYYIKNQDALVITSEESLCPSS